MRYRLSDLPAMLATAGGRRQVRDGVLYRSWPLASALARLYRIALLRRTRIVAIVGSFGKSTTTRAVAAALNAPLRVPVIANAWTSIALAVLRTRPWQAYSAIEIGIDGRGQMKRYATLVRPHIVVVTSIGSEHIDALGTLEVTRSEKAAMVCALRPSGIAVLNGDDANVVWMKALATGRVVTYGFGTTCDVRAERLVLDWPRGSRFRVHAFDQAREVTINLMGRQMIYPVLAAVAVAAVEGLPLDPVLARLAELRPIPGRMQPAALPNGALILRDDYKSPAETIDAALDLLAQVPAGRRMVLLGDVSEPQGDERAVYAALGRRAARTATHLVVIGRGFADYAQGARDAGMPSAAIVDAGRAVHRAAAALKAVLRPGDVLLIKGRRPQKLDRVRLMLQGRAVGCDLSFCDIRTMDCEDCPMLERGWGAHRAVM